VNQAYRSSFGPDPSVLTGSLAMKNPPELPDRVSRGQAGTARRGSAAWAQTAIRAISFGRARAALGCGTFTVTLGPATTIDLGAPYGPQAVPGSVDVTATKKWGMAA
jgi:hypothetical protein